MTTLRTVLVGTEHQGREALTAVIGLRLGDEIELHREPGNRFDRNAIACWFRGRLLGYIPRKQNTPVARVMDAGVAVRAVVADPPIIVAGSIYEKPRLSLEWEG